MARKSNKALLSIYQRNDGWLERVDLPLEGHYAMLRKPSAAELLDLRSELEDATDDRAVLVMLKLSLQSIHDGDGAVLHRKDIVVEDLPGDILDVLAIAAGKAQGMENVGLDDEPGEDLSPPPVT